MTAAQAGPARTKATPPMTASRKSRDRRRLGGAAVLAAALLVAGCGSGAGTAASSSESGSGTGLKKVTFQLNFAAGGFNAGFSLAKQKGYYKNEGLDVTIVKGNGSATTAQLVASGQADIAYADAVAVIQLIAKGAPIKVISTIYQANPNEVSALKATGIKSIADLKGHSIGVPSGSSQTPLLPVLLKANGLSPKDVKQVNLPGAALVPSLLQKNVDAILGSMDFYGIQLAQQGAETDNYLFADHGVPTVSTSIIARTDYLKSDGDTVKKFVAASIKGWQDSLADPKGAIDALKKTFPEVKPEQATSELTVTLPLLCKNGAQSIGKAEPKAWADTQKVLAEVGSVPQDIDPTTYYTYDYLPSTLPAC